MTKCNFYKNSFVLSCGLFVHIFHSTRTYIQKSPEISSRDFHRGQICTIQSPWNSHSVKQRIYDCSRNIAPSFSPTRNDVWSLDLSWSSCNKQLFGLYHIDKSDRHSYHKCRRKFPFGDHFSILATARVVPLSDASLTTS